MDLFYAGDIRLGECELNKEESAHIIKVLRKKKDDLLFFTDGKGNLYQGIILEDNVKKCVVNFTGKSHHPKKENYHLHIAVGPTKNINRTEWFVEKATEIGIDEITPLICEHSERKHLNHTRTEKVMIAAMKQSLKFRLPKLNPVTSFRDLMKKPFTGQKFIAWIDPDQKTTLLKKAYEAGNDAIVLIGPEGDFSPKEVEQAISAGYIPISLGENRLRTETAALVACHTINLMNQ